MTPPMFIQVQHQLVNLSLCENVSLEGETLSFASGNDSFDFEFDSEARAQQAFQELRQFLTNKNLFLGSV
jgi:hypothetical protein